MISDIETKSEEIVRLSLTQKELSQTIYRSVTGLTAFQAEYLSKKIVQKFSEVEDSLSAASA